MPDLMNFLGPHYENQEAIFTVWAPEKEQMRLHIVAPEQKVIEMAKDEWGYFSTRLTGVNAPLQYYFEPEKGKKLPDPASHYQPEGVHGPSQLVDHSRFEWQDATWKNIPQKELIFYEIHVGTFTPEGTFDAIIPRLKDLAETGITALEIMPVSQFSGGRNWGYDGVFPIAVQNSYGGPDGFKRLIDAAHQHGLAVILDVVFNHIGPEGNCFADFGPYFTEKYRTPWGNAMNFDDAWSDGVRAYFSDAIMHWYQHYHLDGLRIDAIHTMFDNGAVSFWELVSEKLKEAQQRFGRPFYLIAESDLNSPRVVQPTAVGGYDLAAQWLDDFHHALYVLLDKNGQERYKDFGQMQQLAKAYTDGFVHSGEYVLFRQRRHGASSAGLSGDTFVVFNQNHDQVGNRVGGERLSVLVDFERQKLAAAAILLSPYLPMLFMGEEYGEDAPFFYFVSHSDPELIRMVSEGRKKEFEAYGWDKEPPEAHDEQTFEKSKIDWNKRLTGKHNVMLRWHKTLIALRKAHPALGNFRKNDVRVNLAGNAFVLHRRSEDQAHEMACCFNLSDSPATIYLPESKPHWKKVLDSQDQEWHPDGSSVTDALPQNARASEMITLEGTGVVVFVSNSRPLRT
ncbi:malto-oligosyltrehalose trehalohydrolase [Dyadobacter sp. MSC1_007]|jgi:maltooligosyltrehalose trehalohydrolase|uniref:malto-oligosyltrehalose trehalohydrolase n=1 Tax=Dyadobacter sp. MSC1_007 TaxID=2909264 RepID=UPI0020309F29|nr:malto-oligosyltrehalose trehalohydrolase [Dyadobacter sp. MSC1_007]